MLGDGASPALGPPRPGSDPIIVTDDADIPAIAVLTCINSRPATSCLLRRWHLPIPTRARAGDVRAPAVIKLERAREGRQTRAAARFRVDVCCRPCVRGLPTGHSGRRQLVFRRVVRLVQPLGTRKRSLCHRMAARLSRCMIRLRRFSVPPFASCSTQARAHTIHIDYLLPVAQPGQYFQHDPRSSVCINHTPRRYL